MKRLLLIFAAALTIAHPIGARQYTVIDSIEKNPVIGATVIGKSGVIKGLTDNNGHISVYDSELPLTVRCIGYESIESPGCGDTIFMTSTTYALREVVVTPIDRPIKRVICFAREYSSGIAGADTLQYYCEYMAEAFVVDRKVKGYKDIDARPTPKGYKRYARISKNGVDSIFKPKRGDDITSLSWFELMACLPDKRLAVPEAILQGAATDTVAGKYGPKFIYQKKKGRFIQKTDVLCDHKNRQWSPFIFKLLGMTVDITEGTFTMSFTDNESNSFGIDEFTNGTYNIHLVGRGKWIKKVFDSKMPVEMDAYLEIYPVDITNITVEEYKRMRNDFSPISFRYPENIKALSPSTDSLISRLDGR